MYQVFTGLVALSLFLLNCTSAGPSNHLALEDTGSQANTVIEGNSHLAEKVEFSSTKVGQIEPLYIGDSRGLLVPSDDETAVGRGFRVRLLNDDGSKWREYRNSESGMHYDSDFQPFRYSSSEAFAVFRVTGHLGDRHEVVVNEKTGFRKFIHVDDPSFMFRTWGEYILGCFAVSFDIHSNPIRSAPGGSEVEAEVSVNVDFKPQKLDGDWLKVAWKSHNKKSEQHTGWIKWKEGDYIILYFFETV